MSTFAAKRKRQIGYVTVRCRGLAKTISQLITLFALPDIWVVRHSLPQGAQVWVRLQIAEGLQKA